MTDDSIKAWSAAYKAEAARRKTEFLKEVNLRLKPWGFRRSGRVFRRPHAVDLQIVDFEDFHGGYRLHLGVYLPELEDVLSRGEYRPAPLKKPHAWQCHVNRYLFEIQPGLQEIGVVDPAEVTAVVGNIERYGLPWLEHASSPDFVGIGSDDLIDGIRRMWRLRAEG